MAKSIKKSTKAKTKTTKKPAVKSQSKTVTKAAKVTKESILSGVLAKRSRTDNSPISRLNKLNAISGVLSLLLAGAAVFLMSNVSYQLFTGLLTKDELTSTAGTVFVPAIRAVRDLELRWAVTSIMLLASILPLLAVTRYKKRYEETLRVGVNPWRWIDVAVVGALMIEVVAVLSGIRDIATLKTLVVLVAITAALGYLCERQNAKGDINSSRKLYLIALVTGVLPWVMIATYAGGTILYGLVRSPWYVYALYATLLASFVGYALNAKRQRKAIQNYELTERNYLIIGIFAKVTFAVILIVGLLKK